MSERGFWVLCLTCHARDYVHGLRQRAERHARRRAESHKSEHPDHEVRFGRANSLGSPVEVPRAD